MIHFKRTEHDLEPGQTTGIAPDGTIITRVESTPIRPGAPEISIVFYKMDRPDIDKRRVRLRWEEICKYHLHEHNVFSLDKKDNMFWCKKVDGKMTVEVLPCLGRDKDGFPLYEERFEEILHPNMMLPYGKRTTFH